MSVVELIGNGDVHTTAVATGEEALGLLKDERFDCMVLDLRLPDMSGLDLGRYDLPIIVYTGKELTRKEELHLKKVADAIIVKEANSPERLLAEVRGGIDDQQCAIGHLDEDRRAQAHVVRIGRRAHRTC